jgi:hypothetical protein
METWLTCHRIDLATVDAPSGAGRLGNIAWMKFVWIAHDSNHPQASDDPVDAMVRTAKEKIFTIRMETLASQSSSESCNLQRESIHKKEYPNRRVIDNYGVLEFPRQIIHSCSFQHEPKGFRVHAEDA